MRENHSQHPNPRSCAYTCRDASGEVPSTIQFDQVSKSFKNVKAVRDVSFNIEDKEIFGLLGPNGAGKTTLILTMATVYAPDTGSIRLNGFGVKENAEKVKELVGICFQDPKYDRILTAREILEWHGKITGVPKEERRRRIEEVLGKFGLQEESRKRTWMLSGGTKKKIETAKVFVQRPPVAVFDEPTAYLDVPSRLMVWDMIKELREEGSTILLATNMMDEADRLSDRVGIMNQGAMVAVDTPTALKRSLVGRDAVEVQVESNPSQYLEEIRQIDEVKDVRIEGNVLLIYVNNGRVMLSHIINKLSAKGAVIQSVNLREPTLEDVFIHYTGSKLI